jgi:hypothetical protein
MSIYKRFEDDDIVEANATVITTGIWSGDTGSLAGDIYTSSVQVGLSGEYYYDMYQADPLLSSSVAEVQFAVTYGHIEGGGAPTLLNDDLATLSTKVVYKQYKSLLLDASDDTFTFLNHNSEHIYVINFQRARLREKLDPGNWQLHLSGANGVFSFIDDSGQTLGDLAANSRAGRVFNVVSGSLTGPDGSTIAAISASGHEELGGQIGFGLVYPDLGIIILNPDAIAPVVGFNPFVGFDTGSHSSSIQNFKYSGSYVPFAPFTGSLNVTSGSVHQYNHEALVRSMQLAMRSGFDFQARSAETISSTHYFVRLRNKEFNYSNNPTFYNPNNGSIILTDFYQNPKVYVTSIGMFNDQNELLAVAKLSRPLEKSFDKEALVRVRLDF